MYIFTFCYYLLFCCKINLLLAENGENLISAHYRINTVIVLFTPNFISEVAIRNLLLYPIVVCVFINKFEGIICNHVPGEIARLSLTFASSTAN